MEPRRRAWSYGSQVSFGAPGELVFRQGTQLNSVARVKTDGTGLERILDSVSDMHFVSPDGSWVSVSGMFDGVDATFAVSLKDRTRKLICAAICQPRWSDDGAYLYVTMNPTPSQGRPTLAFRIPPGTGVPVLPAQGLSPHAAEEVRGIPIIGQDWPAPGPDPQTYAFVKSEFVGNLFRIPLH